MAAELRPGCELYFAYGSNMLEQRLKDRVKSAEFLLNAWIRGYEVRFRKMSIDGSGKADLVQTGVVEVGKRFMNQSSGNIQTNKHDMRFELTQDAGICIHVKNAQVANI